MCTAAFADPGKRHVEEQSFIRLSEVQCTTLSHAPPWDVTGQIRWFYLQPLLLDYDNTADCHHGVCIDPIQYKNIGVFGEKAGISVELSQPGLALSTGTHLFLSIDETGEVFHRVAIRESESYIGYIKELLGVPFVYGPTYEEGFGHQTDRGIGADCVATLIYGQRRLGNRAPYVAPEKLYEYTTTVSDSTRIKNDEILVGDILHFGFQTALISKDMPPIGRLTDNDKVIHSFHSAVEEVDFSSLGYRNMPYDVLRWIDLTPHQTKPFHLIKFQTL